ncbi:MAG TPA: branched-chain amino acid ABC transporter permease [Deltaproteobacteria bacterium]|nr:branched-chain amino acid ABC transporter permease [Deltaproteobacteria bacterium]
MSLAVDIVISGLISGSIYALLAVSFSLIFGVARIINLAHTAFYMVAAYCIYWVSAQLGWSPFAGMFIGIILVTVLGIIAYQLILKPIREHEAAVLVATIAMAMILEQLVSLKFGGSYLSSPVLIQGFFTFLGVKVMYQELLTIGTALILLGVLVLFLFKTNTGLAVRSTAQDREVANLMGINESRVAMLAMAVSVGLAGFAGAVVAPLRILDPHMWSPPLIMMLAAVVLGGLGSLKGSFYGAFILGFTEAIIVFLAPAGAFLRGPVALTVMIMVLVVRPEGLFGVYFEEER